MCNKFEKRVISNEIHTEKETNDEMETMDQLKSYLTVKKKPKKMTKRENKISLLKCKNKLSVIFAKTHPNIFLTN